jgi:hypothetical protein
MDPCSLPSPCQGDLMPAHDIIDNRKEILVDHINRILGSTEAARFAVGYFFLSSLTSITDKLKGVYLGGTPILSGCPSWGVVGVILPW